MQKTQDQLLNTSDISTIQQMQRKSSEGMSEKETEQIEFRLKRKRKYDEANGREKMEETLKIKVKKNKKKKKKKIKLEESKEVEILSTKKMKRKKKKKRKKEKRDMSKKLELYKEETAGSDEEHGMDDDTKKTPRKDTFKERAKMGAIQEKDTAIITEDEILSEELKERLELIDNGYTPKHIQHLSQTASLYEDFGDCERHPLLLSLTTSSDQLQKANVKFAFGAWTNKELSILHENIKTFKTRYNIKSFKEFFQDLNLSKCAGIESHLDLYIELGTGILRPLRSVRGKIEWIYSKQNEKTAEGHYTEKEMERLISLQRRYGSDWKYISSLMNRTPHSLARRFTDLVEIYNIKNNNSDLTAIPENLTVISRDRSYFTEEDDEKIREGVQLFKKKNEKTDWKAVASHVGNHPTRMVRQRWELKNISSKSKRSININKYKLTIRCLRLFITSNCNEFSQINWDMVAAGINMNLESIIVKTVFLKYLSIHVPGYRDMSFEEILQYLLKHKFSSGMSAETRVLRKQEIHETIKLE